MLLKINSLQIHYTVQGQGQPIVLLTGWNCTLKYFESLQQYLSQSFQVFAFEWPGFGLSSLMLQAWGTADYAELLFQFLKTLNIQNPIIMGHSVGGRIALYLASQHRLSIKKLILIGSSGIRFKQPGLVRLRIKIFKLLAHTPILKTLLRPFIRWYKQKYGSVDYRAAEGVLRDSLVKILSEDLQPLLSSIETPTDLIWGENDTESPLKMGQIMQQQLSRARLTVLPHCGHFPFLEQKERFREVLKVALSS